MQTENRVLTKISTKLAPHFPHDGKFFSVPFELLSEFAIDKFWMKSWLDMTTNKFHVPFELCHFFVLRNLWFLSIQKFQNNQFILASKLSKLTKFYTKI